MGATLQDSNRHPANRPENRPPGVSKNGRARKARQVLVAHDNRILDGISDRA
jgi:hypothetical protein